MKIRFYIKTVNVFFRYWLYRRFPKLCSKLGIDTLPFGFYINVTTSCNLKCKYCVISKEKSTGFPNWHKKKEKTVSWNLLVKAINECAEMSVPFVSITGGEPLLIKNIYKIGRLAGEKGIITNLNTNGLLINIENASLLARSFDYIRISLNGSKEIHDKLTGVKGSYDRTLEAMKMLMNIKNKRAKVGINCILNKSTINMLPQFVRKMQNSADFIGILPEFSFDQSTGDLAGLNRQELSGLKNKLKEINKINKVRPKIHIENFKLMKPNECDAGLLYMYMIPNGNVLQCPFVTEKMVLNSVDYNEEDIGNLNKTPLKIIYKNFKKKKLENCKGCYANCTLEISRIFNKNISYHLVNFNDWL